MTTKVKMIIKDKFWIVEENGDRIGTLSLNDDRYMFSNKVETCYFDNTQQIKKKFGFNITWSDKSSSTEKVVDTKLEAYGYPTSVAPYNSIYDVKRRLPLFTKSEKSKSMYCAGYHIIKFNKGWVRSFCPKLKTVEQYQTKGPFKTEFEMKEELSRANS